MTHDWAKAVLNAVQVVDEQITEHDLNSEDGATMNQRNVDRLTPLLANLGYVYTLDTVNEMIMVKPENKRVGLAISLVDEESKNDDEVGLTVYVLHFYNEDFN